MAEQIRAVMTGTPDQRVEALQKLLGYPIRERDPETDLFWYLRPGADIEIAQDTQPIAVGFLELLNNASEPEIKATLTSPIHDLSKHYAAVQDVLNQPAMYLLLPEQPQVGRVVMILPVEGKFRQNQIISFRWDELELRSRLRRLQSSELPPAEQKALLAIPPVERAFYAPAKTASQLAKELAGVAQKIEQAIPDVYEAEGDNGYLHKLLQSFQRELLPSLKLKSDNDKDYSFADIYAQTIAYGLFTARVFSYAIDQREGKGRQTDFNRQAAWQLLPETNPFLRQLFKDVSERQAEELGEELLEAISELFAILRAAEMQTILDDFRAKMNREDIVIRFYEDFLTAYKPKMRERRGVYYTPEPVVSYMVRSVDILLKEKFDKPLGLADPEVMILDPACGTGTFLLWIFQLIHKRFEENPEALTDGLEDQSWSGYVRERLLPRVFGFELLMAPYAIAHLKLGLFLEETGYQFDRGNRLGVYLTNALEQSTQNKPQIPFEEFIAVEGEAALKVKREEPLMVIIGNPPYSVSSANQGEWITNLIEDYKRNVRTEEIQIQSLSNDYIKFIRFAQWQIERSDGGIVALITGNGYKGGPLFRDMRANLIKTFHEIYLLDLHGSIRWGESSPNGNKDENVFDIQQGVATLLMLKNRPSTLEGTLYGSDLWGSRDSKYETLNQITAKHLNWSRVNPKEPYYYFTEISQEEKNREKEYILGWAVPDIFGTGNRRKDQNRFWGTGFATRHDKFAIGATSDEVVSNVEQFAHHNGPLDDLKSRFRLCTTSHWNPVESKLRLASISIKDNVMKILYRPFDYRYTVYLRDVVLEPRTEFMQYLFKDIDPLNMALVVARIINAEEPNHFFVSNLPVEKIFLSNKTSNNSFVFPLYIQDQKGDQSSLLEENRRPNISQGFLRQCRDSLGFLPSPESIFFYVYAILNSPTYRIRYRDFLRKDFPRIHLTRNTQLFEVLTAYGKELVQIHLMNSTKLENLVDEFGGNGDRIVDPGHPKYANGKVTINKHGDGFTGVPEEVWNFYVGGYQVCHKWLKDRKGRTLSDDDILHYQRIVVALKETIELMQKIDDAIPSWPIE